MRLEEVGYRLTQESKETNRLLRLLINRIDKQERTLRDIKRRIVVTEVPIYAETDEVTYDDVMEKLQAVASEPYGGGIRFEGEAKYAGDESGEGVARFPMPDGAWIVVYTDDKGEITKTFYEDRRGNRTPVIIDEGGNIRTVEGDDAN